MWRYEKQFEKRRPHEPSQRERIREILQQQKPSTLSESRLAYAEVLRQYLDRFAAKRELDSVIQSHVREIPGNLSLLFDAWHKVNVGEELLPVEARNLIENAQTHAGRVNQLFNLRIQKLASEAKSPALQVLHLSVGDVNPKILKLPPVPALTAAGKGKGAQKEAVQKEIRELWKFHKGGHMLLAAASKALSVKGLNVFFAGREAWSAALGFKAFERLHRDFFQELSLRLPKEKKNIRQSIRALDKNIAP